MKKALLGLSIIAILSPATASAENFSSYVGVSVGHSELDIKSDQTNTLAASGISVSDDTDVGFKVYGGNRFHKNIAIEIYYADLGEVTFTDGVNSVTAQSDGFGISALGIIPISENFELFGKIGTFKWDASYESTTGATAGTDDLDETYGLGALFYIDNISFRIEYEEYGFGDVDVDMISAGIAYNY